MKKKKLQIGEADAEKIEVGPLLEWQTQERLAARITELGPYELATLAARICPELCLKDPVRAIEVAKRLLVATSIEKTGCPERRFSQRREGDFAVFIPRVQHA
jgi:hypothetical protein